MSPISTVATDVICFDTDLGWTALAIRQELVGSIKFGYSSELALLDSIEGDFDVRKPRDNERFWVAQLQQFLAGGQVDLNSIPIRPSQDSRFTRNVIEHCRRIPYGSTLTYGQLAAAAGSSRAARAVGTVMRKNRFPLVVPCHRVIASNGLGGYSATGGTKIKSRLLTMEKLQVSGIQESRGHSPLADGARA